MNFFTDQALEESLSRGMHDLLHMRSLEGGRPLTPNCLDFESPRLQHREGDMAAESLVSRVQLWDSEEGPPDERERRI